MRTIHLLIKPVSGRCNMRCRYCFYEDISKNRAAKDLGVMSMETARRLIHAAYDDASRGCDITFAFQGGEPTLAGLDFFKEFVAEQKRMARRDIHVQYAFQTNGLLLDAQWAAFFRENRFLVGLSIDGGKALHDQNRADASDGTWARAVDSLRLMQRFEVDVNVLSVVTKQSVVRSHKVYAALKKLGVHYIQFIPCLDPMDTQWGRTPYSLHPGDYGRFLCDVFDDWYDDWKNGRYVSVQFFDDCVHRMMGLPAGACTTSGQCGGSLVAEADGSLYPCDFYVLDAWRLGWIGEIGVKDAMESPRAMSFRKEGRTKPESCAHCPWRPLCNGGCKRDCRVEEGECKNFHCSSFQHFFAHSYTRLREIAHAEARYAAGAQVSQG